MLLKLLAIFNVPLSYVLAPILHYLESDCEGLLGGIMKTTKTSPITEQVEKKKSSVDLLKLMGGGKAQAVRAPQAKGHDSMLAVYKDRLTYTFILEQEVASIHYDHSKRDIFFKGHNIKNMRLKEVQIRALNGLKGILMQDGRAKELLPDYEATLGKILADNK